MSLLPRALNRLLRPGLPLPGSGTSASSSLSLMPRSPLPLFGSGPSAASTRSMQMTSPRPLPRSTGPTAAPVPSMAVKQPAASALGAAGNGATGSGATGNQGARPNGYSVLYREIFPAMIPVLLISTTIFLSLSLTRTHLSHALSLQESTERIASLEEELAHLRRDQRRQIARERRERERILPMVVERVLQRVGVRGEDEEEEDVEDEVLRLGGKESEKSGAGKQDERLVV